MTNLFCFLCLTAGRRIEVKRDGLNGKPPMAPPTGRVIQVMTHRRTHSDLNESHSAIDRWRQYETKVKTEPKAVAQPESQCAVAALGKFIQFLYAYSSSRKYRLLYSYF